MNDQQDLMARLPELPDEHTGNRFGHPKLYTADQMHAYALEAAAQLGRVDLEAAARYGWEHSSWEWESVRIGIDERFNTTPQPDSKEPR